MVAQNIMQILSSLGDDWQPLSWEQYAAERAKDGKYYDYEKGYFDAVIPYCESADTAATLFPVWAQAAEAAKAEGGE